MTQSTDYERLIRMVGLARGLEMAGYYNAAKVAWAAAYSHELHESSQRGVPTQPDEIQRELKAAISDLRDSGAGAGLIAGLERGLAALADGDAIPASDIGEVHVCRTCGEVVFGESPESCPACGAWELTFKTFPAVYYLEPLPPNQALDALSAVPELLSGLITGIDAGRMAHQPKPGEWSLNETLAHFLSAQELLAGRVVRMLAEDNPSLKSVSVAEMGQSEKPSAAEMFEKFAVSRRDTVARLIAAAPSGWWRTGLHDEFGQVTVLQQASYFAKHDHSHLTQIRQILKTLV